MSHARACCAIQLAFTLFGNYRPVRSNSSVSLCPVAENQVRQEVCPSDSNLNAGSKTCSWPLVTASVASRPPANASAPSATSPRTPPSKGSTEMETPLSRRLRCSTSSETSATLRSVRQRRTDWCVSSTLTKMADFHSKSK